MARREREHEQPFDILAYSESENENVQQSLSFTSLDLGGWKKRFHAMCSSSDMTFANCFKFCKILKFISTQNYFNLK